MGERANAQVREGRGDICYTCSPVGPRAAYNTKLKSRKWTEGRDTAFLTPHFRHVPSTDGVNPPSPRKVSHPAFFDGLPLLLHRPHFSPAPGLSRTDIISAVADGCRLLMADYIPSITAALTLSPSRSICHHTSCL